MSLPARAELQQRLGYEFGDAALLERALAHRSWVAESDATHSNERLEFLGDAVLGYLIADIVFHRFTDLPEGSLTDLRKSVVNAQALADVATGIDLGRHILLGRGEDAGGGRHKVSILSDVMEAVLAAVYLDGGPQAAAGLVQRLFGDRLDDSVGALALLDSKSALQELVARLGLAQPAYHVRSTGPDHDKRFFARVAIGGIERGSGGGRSKKAAEQAAATAAVAALSDA